MSVARAHDPADGEAPEIYGRRHFPRQLPEPELYPMPGGGRSTLPPMICKLRYGAWDRVQTSPVARDGGPHR